MKITRRFCGIGALSIGAISLTRCAAFSSAANEITVDLPNAQAEATALFSAFTTLAGVSPSPAVANLLVTAKAALTKLTSLAGDAATYIPEVQAVIAAFTPLISLLPIPGATLTALNAGLGLLSALMNGMKTITAPAAPATPAMGATPMVIISAPIPIPVPIS